MHQEPTSLSVSVPPDTSAALQQQIDWSHRRIQNLLDEAREFRSEQEQLRAQIRSARAERAHAARLLVRAERLVRSMENGMHAMRRSISMQLGYLLIHSTRSLGGLVRLPLGVVRLARELLRSDRKMPGKERAVVAVPVPQQWFPTALRRELSKFHADFARTDKASLPTSGTGEKRNIAYRFSSLPEDLREVRLASIMDEFTFSAYRECCNVTQLTADAWRAQVDSAEPHLLFIESAWDGKDSTWQRKISGTAVELRRLVQYCRAKNIPVVFWSKEDPVHFKTFLNTAKLADAVFTTDVDCVAHYRRELGHDRVYALPFATQPSSHNPIERYERNHSACFAGSYYLRYPVRQRDFANLISAARSTCGVDIYDRNHGKDHPNFIFPEEYHTNILGGLSFDQIDLAYKGYDYGININTVKNSQSMFARRVFDLLASNTIVISNYSRGMRLMFGDLVMASDNADQLVIRIDELRSDDCRRRKLRLKGLRKVMREHTYEHRLAYVLEKVFGRSARPGEPLLTVVARADSDAQLEGIMAAYTRQTWEKKQIVIFFGNGYVPSQLPTVSSLRILSKRQASSRTMAELAKGGFVAPFHCNDHYGRNYLTDLALGLTYSDSEALGKAAHYRANSAGGGVTLEGDGQQYRHRSAIAIRRAIVRAEALGQVSVADWISRLDTGLFEGDVLALDEFNYCEGGAASNIEDEVGDLVIDEGLRLDQLVRLFEPGEVSGQSEGLRSRDESAGLPGMAGREIFTLLDEIPSSYVVAEPDAESLVFRSTLPKGKQCYVYLSREFAPRDLQFSDIGRMQLVCGNNDAVDLVLVYRNSIGEKISHSILRSGVNVSVSVPTGVSSVQIGMRIRAAGEIRIARLVFEHVPLGVDTVITRARHLLLAKNYPSYDDLYKHAFVHRRVMEYKAAGLPMDVFRIGSVGLTSYEFEGIDVVYGQNEHLRAMLSSGSYEAVLVHFLDRNMWNVLQEFVDSTRIFVWAHGAEIQSASRRQFDLSNDDHERAVALGEQRMKFWRELFEDPHPNMRFVFVSDWFARDVFEDVGIALPVESYEVIHNFIDTRLFEYQEKEAAQRLRILSIRPFESRKYANDLSVAAVIALKHQPFFSDLHFRFIGDGKLFEQTMAPLQGLSNVVIERGFLSQNEIAALHREYGVFLNPSRMDAQGVSRDEAMSSGLVPITTRVTAIPEFVDDSCGLLVDPEDAQGLADAIAKLYAEPDLFLRLSRAAAQRVRLQSGFEPTIAREMALVTSTQSTTCG